MADKTTYTSSQWLTSALHVVRSETNTAVKVTLVDGDVQASSGGWTGYGIHVRTGAGSYYNDGKSTDKWSQYTMADADGVLNGTDWVASAKSNVTFPKKKTAYIAAVWADVYSAEVSGYGAWPYAVPGQNKQEFTVPALGSYKVKYKLDGGTWSLDDATQTKWYGEALELRSKKPTKAGYTFKGWSGSNGKSYDPGDTYKANEALTLTAQWKQITYAVAYVNGGHGTAPDSQTKYDGTALTLRGAITGVTGYTFSKWKSTEGDTYAAKGTYKADKATKMTAQWTTDTYAITFNGNGGTSSSATQTYGVAIKLPSSTRTGYTFAGWYTAATKGSLVGKAGDSAKPNAKTTYYAQWTANTYTITYSPNGGTVSPTKQTQTYAVAVTTPKATRDYYTFNGWYTAATGGTKVVAGGASYTPNASKTLYAQWTRNYSAPSITKVVAKRNADDETKADVTVTWAKDAAIDGHVSIAIGTSTLDPVTVGKVASGETEFSAVGSLSTTSKYTVTATITDDSGQTAGKSAIITPVFFTLDFGSNGKSIGIGQAAADDITTTNGQLDIAMKTNLTSDSTIGGCTVLKSVPANAVFTDTKYTLPAATSSTLGGVKVGTNITNANGTISLTQANVTAALGYTPPKTDTNTTYSAGTGLSLSGTTFSVTYTSSTLGTNAWIKRYGNVVTLYLDGYNPNVAIANKDSLPIAVPEGFRPAHDMWCALNALGIGDYGKRFKIKTGGGIEYRGDATLSKGTAFYFTATWVI